MTTPIPYLSDEWLTEADQAVADLAPLTSPLVVTMDISGGPRGRCRYQIVLGPDRVGFRAIDEADSGNGHHSGDVSMTMEWAVATGVAQGHLGAQRAFLDGDIQLGGDATRLLGHQEALAAVDDRLSELRGRTDFSNSE